MSEFVREKKKKIHRKVFLISCLRIDSWCLRGYESKLARIAQAPRVDTKPIGFFVQRAVFWGLLCSYALGFYNRQIFEVLKSHFCENPKDFYNQLAYHGQFIQFPWVAKSAWSMFLFVYWFLFIFHFDYWFWSFADCFDDIKALF